jgi:hypothetical protein|tara:strand:+ start:364 stop:510 length:147 start_codon:yes stop_codon:yes gene_type:complete
MGGTPNLYDSSDLCCYGIGEAEGEPFFTADVCATYGDSGMNCLTCANL